MEKGFCIFYIFLLEFMVYFLIIIGIFRKLDERGCSNMELIDDLFVGGNVTELETIVYSLRRGIPVLHLHCIVYFEDKNRLEILSSHELFHERNKNRPAKIAGIAMGRREAVDLLVFMAEEAQKNGRNPGNPKELF